MIPLVILWCGLLLCLPPPTSPACFLGKEAECQDANFVPGSDLAGEGFDITKMQRLGTFVIDMSKWELKNNTCNLCKNPFMQNKKQKLPVSVIYWRATQKCKRSLSSSIYESSESLVSSSTSSVENNWKAGLGIGNAVSKMSLMLAGTNSKLAEYSMTKTKKDKFSFIKHILVNSCDEYHGKPKYININVCYFSQYIVKLGGTVQSVTSVKQCMATLQDLSMDEVKACLDVEASASVMGRISIDTAYSHCKQSKDNRLSTHSFANSFTDRLTEIMGGHAQDTALLFSASNDPGAFNQWLSTVPEKPDMISFSLKPLHMLLPVKNPKHEQLCRAIRDYILQSALLKNCSTPCKAGIATNPKEPCVCSCHNNPGVKANCCPAQRGLAQISVTVMKATGLWGDYFSQTDGYVKVLRNHKVFLGETAVIWNQNSPTWNWKFDLGSFVLSQFGGLRLEVWDRDNKWDDDLLGACNIQLKAGIKEEFCQLNHGLLYYKTSVTCGPSLAGSSCTDYVGSPMASHLEKVYVSRHARPILKDELVKMGVLLDERRLLFSQTNNPKSKTQTL
uniref:Perforin-1-like n=1 Tax=Sinocyclocheilus anshuiensis TaxID=1608454 RepID=A0A671QKD0_9TELE